MIRTDEGPVSDDDLDEEAIQAKVQELEEAMHGISAKLYEAAAANMAEEGDGDHTGIDGAEDVVDADFEVVDEDEDESLSNQTMQRSHVNSSCTMGNHGIGRSTPCGTGDIEMSPWDSVRHLF